VLLRAVAARAATAAVLLLVGTTAGCGGDGDDDEPTSATGRFGQIHQGVCAAAQFAESGDRKRAEEAFDDVHFGVHALVQAVEQQDRAAAARLLQAMERVERQGTTANLEALVEPVAESIELTGGTAPDTCP
jgi:hypothetical protein